jgi:4-amino-4-deoxy-L-arabinose transferase-like glycosyltransferase
MPTTRPSGLAVVAMAALVLLPNLGGPPLWDDDEPRNAACSVAMHKGGDWIVPTFNGRLRVEKPALVNWLHLAGFAVAGVNETGSRLASAILTLGTCLLTARIAGILFRPEVGTWAGITMATCLWTGIAGRAATPDAPLAFCTTLALWLFVRGCGNAMPGGTGWRHAPVRLPVWTAVGIGIACGLAVLAKGPVGVVLPLAGLGGFCWWQAALDPGRRGPWLDRIAASCGDAVRGLRPLLILAVAAAVALPWYVLVSLRTDGIWLREFLLVHNVGRFAAPMEGHSGSALVYYPAVVLIGMFPWSMASALVALHAVRTARSAANDAAALRLTACWLAAWLVPLSMAGTKLPGYLWPAYPALATAVGLFVADWIRRPSAATDGWMRLAWIFLAASGVALGVGLPLAARRFAPGAEWLGFIGLVPVIGAAIAWHSQSLRSRLAASAAWAVTACATVGLLVGVGPAALGPSGGTRQLIAGLAAGGGSRPVPMASFGAPASAAFYGGRLAPDGVVRDLADPADAARFVASNPGAHFVIDARYERQFSSALPASYRVVQTAVSFPTNRTLLLLGPRPESPSIARASGVESAALRR